MDYAAKDENTQGPWTPEAEAVKIRGRVWGPSCVELRAVYFNALSNFLSSDFKIYLRIFTYIYGH